MSREVTNLVIRNAEILPYGFRNFSGNPTKVNPQGGDAARKFVIKLNNPESQIKYRGLNVDPNDIFEMLREDGWTGLQVLPPRNEDEEASYILNVKVKYRNAAGEPIFAKYMPTVVQYTDNADKGVKLNEETIGGLDDADICEAKVSVNPYEWDKVSKPGEYSPRLKTLYVKLEEELDEFEEETFGHREVAERAMPNIDDDDLPF